MARRSTRNAAKFVASLLGSLVLLGLLARLASSGEAAAGKSRPALKKPANIDATVALPPAAGRPVDFHREVLPLLARHCARCHTSGKHEGALAIDSREKLLAGGDSGPTVVVGHSDQSLLVELISGRDPDRIMPAEGRKLSAEEIGILRAWIDQGMTWEKGVALTSFPTARWEPRRVELPPTADVENPGAQRAAENPIDLLLTPYLKRHAIVADEPVDDRTFARRAFLDLVGLPPRPEDVEVLTRDGRPDKRRELVRRLLAEREQYAIHWLSFWNDALRNDYHGPGYIDGGRKQITGWLYRSLKENKPYDQFVRELVSGQGDAAGFVQGIVWRGVVNASQRPEMQAAQNVSQVFLGINLKCASCHDSFVSEWKLNDAYGLASVFAAGPLEVHRCDTPQGKFVEPRFLAASLGAVDPKAPLATRREQAAAAMTGPKNGRLARTIVNRLWARLMGRGLVKPVDSMDNPPWNADLLDYLAVDLAEHGYDLKRTLELIATSRAYQMKSVGAPPATEKDYVFRGPLVKRLSAEQFVDAISTVSGVWQPVTPQMIRNAGGGGGGQLAAIGWKNRSATTKEPPKGDVGSPDFRVVGLRASLVDGDALTRALGRPGREQVVTSREPAATTLQVLELTNGTTLDKILKQSAEKWLKESLPADALIDRLYLRTLGRKPGAKELEVARGLVGTSPTRDGVEDLVWSLLMLPEFQLIE